ncbi:MAG: hypothetical protein HY796_06370 [Elusimicrobia bacterium]|nr:hypothetical protein [Elusimicrobiota bacterium]
MKRRVLAEAGVLTMMVFLVGCDEVKFNGTLGVRETITFAQEGEDRNICDQKPDPSNCRQAVNVVLNPGQFQTKVTLGKSGQQKYIKMEVKTSNSPTVIEMNFDKDIELGEHFVLKADQIKQAFDLAGDIATKVDRTQEETGMESCTYQTQEWVCRSAEAVKSEESDSEAFNDLAASVEELGEKYGPYPGPGQYYGPQPPVCHPVWVTRPGRQYVRFYYETTTKDIAARFVQSDKNLADYQGRSSRTEKIYTYQGQCY